MKGLRRSAVNFIRCEHPFVAQIINASLKLQNLMKTHGEESNQPNFVQMIIFTSQLNGTPILCKDLSVVELVSQFNMCRQICPAVVGRGATRNGAAKIPLPCVSLHMVSQAPLDVKLPPTCGTLIVLVVPAALLLAVSSTFRVLKTFPTI